MWSGQFHQLFTFQLGGVALVSKPLTTQIPKAETQHKTCQTTRPQTQASVYQSFWTFICDQTEMMMTTTKSNMSSNWCNTSSNATSTPSATTSAYQVVQLVEHHDLDRCHNCGFIVLFNNYIKCSVNILLQHTDIHSLHLILPITREMANHTEFLTQYVPTDRIHYNRFNFNLWQCQGVVFVFVPFVDIFMGMVWHTYS